MTAPVNRQDKGNSTGVVAEVRRGVRDLPKGVSGKLGGTLVGEALELTNDDARALLEPAIPEYQRV